MADKKQFIDYYLTHGKSDYTWDDLAKIFHFVSGNALRKFVKRNGHTFRREFGNKPPRETYSLVQEQQGTGEGLLSKDTSASYKMKEENSNRETGEKVLTFESKTPLTPAQIDEVAGVDNITRIVSRTWLKSHKNDIWTYSICTKLIDKTESEKTDYKKEFEEFLKEKIEDKGIIKRIPKTNKLSNALIISLSDLHIDKKTYKEETGEEGSTSTQVHRALEASIDIIDRAVASHPIEKIYLIGGNDFFHANNAANTTKKGTPLDVDGRWNSSFKAGLSLMTTIIDYAKNVAPVEYITVLGNHSPEREFYLSVTLDAYYRNDENVIVETVNNVRKYFRYGNSTFMLSHEFGNKAKDLPIVFALENAKDFSECKYKFVLSGHIHSKQELMYAGTSEQYGILHKVMPSMSSTDAWHHENLYIGNQKSCIGLIINSQYGEIAELIYNE